MEKLKLILTMFVAAVFMLQACEEEAPGPNGNATISGLVEEHNDDPEPEEEHGGLEGATVYIWYGQTSEMGDADDMVTTTAAGFEFENLSKGDYFLKAEYLDDHDGEETLLTGSATITIEKKAEEVEVEIEVEEEGHE